MKCMKEMNIIAKISCYFLAQCSYSKLVQRIFKYSEVRFTSLTLDKKLNGLIYRARFYVKIYRSYKLLKTVRFFGTPCTTAVHPAWGTTYP